MQHASRNTQATGILLFFSSSSLSFFFLFFVYLHVHARFPLVQIFLFKSFAWEEKVEREPLPDVLTNFSPIFPYDRISILRILIFDIYFILRKKKYVIRTLEEEERKCPTTRSFLPLEDRPPSLFSPPFLPSLRPFLAPSRY